MTFSEFKNQLETLVSNGILLTVVSVKSEDWYLFSEIGSLIQTKSNNGNLIFKNIYYGNSN